MKKALAVVAGIVVYAAGVTVIAAFTYIVATSLSKVQ